MNNLKIVYVKWIDSTHFSLGWNRDDLEKLNAQEIETVGYLVNENDRYINISHSRGGEGTGYVTYDAYLIPKGCIVERTDLVQPIKEEVEDERKSN